MEQEKIMQLAEIQTLQNLLDVSHSYVKVNVIRSRKKKVTWSKLTEITGLDSTRLQRIVHGELGEMSSKFLVNACNGLFECLNGNPSKPIKPKKARGNAAQRISV